MKKTMGVPILGLSLLSIGIMGSPFQSTMVDTQPAPVQYSETGTIIISHNVSSLFSGTSMTAGTTETGTFEIKNTGTLPITKMDLKINATGGLANNPAPNKTWETISPTTGEKITVTGPANKPVTLSATSCGQTWVNNTCSSGQQMLFTNAATSGNSPQSSFVPRNDTLLPGQSVFIKVTATLPADAGKEYAGEQVALSAKVTGVQRAGVKKQ